MSHSPDQRTPTWARTDHRPAAWGDRSGPGPGPAPGPPSPFTPPCEQSAFEAEAASYDRNFTDTELGRRYRAATWGRFDACFPPGSQVLEVNCGTGADAVELARRDVRVVATDQAPAMVAATAAKARAEGVAARVVTGQLDLSHPASWRLDIPGAGFDGLLSNFGGLNCVVDLGPVAEGLAGVLRPGAVALVCVMGRCVPWEIAWFAARWEPATALRRWRRHPSWRGLPLRYPTPAGLRRAFEPWFTCRRVAALGALLPPPYAEAWAGRHLGLVDRLDRWERRVETVPPLPWLADHYLVELVRV